MASNDRIEAAKAELARRERLAAAQAELDRRQSAQVEEAPPENPYGLKALFNYAQKIQGQREALKTLLTGTIADPVANIGGGIQMYANPHDPTAGPAARDRIRDTLTYQPKSEEGKKIVGGIGALAEKYVEPYIEAARLGDEALEMGLPEPVARFAEAIPENVGAVMAPLGIRRGYDPDDPVKPFDLDAAGNPKPQISKKAGIATDLRNAPTNTRTAGYKLGPGGKAVKEPFSGPQRAALRQGWNEDIVAGTRGASPSTKLQAKRMVQAQRSRGVSSKNKMSIRYTDVPGQNLEKRYVFLDRANAEAGRRIGAISKELGKNGVVVDVGQQIQALDDTLRELGVTVQPNGKIDFSMARVVKGDHAMIRESINHIRNVMKRANGTTLNFQDAHELKQIIRKSGLSYKETFNRPGASPQTQNIFKDFTRSIDKVMDGKSSAYDKANIKFSETRDILADFENFAKDRILKDEAYRSLGDLTRRVTSNAVSRNDVIQIINKADDIGRKYGMPFDDDLMFQIDLANNFDSMFGVPAESGFAAQISKGIQGAGGFATQSSEMQAATALNKIAQTALRQSPEKALDTLEALTR